MRRRVKGEQVSKSPGSREIPWGKKGTTNTCIAGGYLVNLTRQ